MANLQRALVFSDATLTDKISQYVGNIYGVLTGDTDEWNQISNMSDNFFVSEWQKILVCGQPKETALELKKVQRLL